MSRTASNRTREGGPSPTGPALDGLQERIDALTRTDAYPSRVRHVEVLQTPCSVLFLAGDRAYKLRKPVRHGTFDGSKVEVRRHLCQEEVRLNRRLSPSMYLGLLPVTRNGRVLLEGDGACIDWVVEMARLPADRMLDEMLASERVGPDEFEAVAATLAHFHDRARTGPSVNRHGLASVVVQSVLAEIDRVASVARDAGPAQAAAAAPLDGLRQRVGEFAERSHELLERRVAEWRIREGHGDLHAGHICLVGENVLVYGCVESDRAARCGDVASDLAFLSLDLERRGYGPAAAFLVRTYAQLADDAELPRLIGLYAAWHALSRAKCELLTSLDGDLPHDERARAGASARVFLDLAVSRDLAT